MRKLSTSIVVVVVLLIVPFAAVGAASLIVEGDAGWDCTTMGNQDCGPDEASVLIEGDVGWDCTAMGNGTCGSAPPPSPTSLAPPYAITDEVNECTPSTISTPLPPETAACVTSFERDPQTGAVQISSSVTSATAARSTVLLRWVAQHELPAPVSEMNYVVEFDVESAFGAVALPDSDATVRVHADVLHDGCGTCFDSTSERFVELGNPEPCQEGPCDPDPCLENPCVGARNAERLSFPLRIQGPSGEDLPAGTITIRIVYSVDLIARRVARESQLLPVGPSLATGSLEISATRVRVA